MNRKGINYDVGIEFNAANLSRPVFSIEIITRELQIIKNDLHCNAIRISGTDIKRLRTTAEIALEMGFEVWLSPHLHDHDKQQTFAYTLQCALMAEELRQQNKNLVFILGCELMLFMNGILEGNNIYERISSLSSMDGTKFLDANTKLNAFLKDTCENIRRVFKGKVTYASVPVLENVDWSLFDFISLDYYRDKRNRPTYEADLDGFFKHNKPVIITEVGCCTYQGAEDAGGAGFMILDPDNPGQLNGTYIRDESLQAREVGELISVLESHGVDGIFVFTFVAPVFLYNENPLYDLDMACYALVTSYGDKKGKTYSDMTWEPKKAFYVVANKYKSN